MKHYSNTTLHHNVFKKRFSSKLYDLLGLFPSRYTFALKGQKNTYLCVECSDQWTAFQGKNEILMHAMKKTKVTN